MDVASKNSNEQGPSARTISSMFYDEESSYDANLVVLRSSRLSLKDSMYKEESTLRSNGDDSAKKGLIAEFMLSKEDTNLLEKITLKKEKVIPGVVLVPKPRHEPKVPLGTIISARNKEGSSDDDASRVSVMSADRLKDIRPTSEEYGGVFEHLLQDWPEQKSDKSDDARSQSGFSDCTVVNPGKYIRGKGKIKAKEETRDSIFSVSIAEENFVNINKKHGSIMSHQPVIKPLKLKKQTITQSHVNDFIHTQTDIEEKDKDFNKDTIILAKQLKDSPTGKKDAQRKFILRQNKKLEENLQGPRLVTLSNLQKPVNTLIGGQQKSILNRFLKGQKFDNLSTYEYQPFLRSFEHARSKTLDQPTPLHISKNHQPLPMLETRADGEAVKDSRSLSKEIYTRYKRSTANKSTNFNAVDRFATRAWKQGELGHSVALPWHEPRFMNSDKLNKSVFHEVPALFELDKSVSREVARADSKVGFKIFRDRQIERSEEFFQSRHKYEYQSPASSSKIPKLHMLDVISTAGSAHMNSYG